MTFHGIIFEVLDKFWCNLRQFSFRNRTFLETLFIVLYTSEQIALVFLTFSATSVEDLNFVISIFAIIVLTTFSLHKLVMESRIKVLEEDLSDLKVKEEAIAEFATKIIEKYEQQYESVTKHLNRENSIRSKR